MTDRPTNQPTNQPTDQPTDGQSGVKSRVHATKKKANKDIKDSKKEEMIEGNRIRIQPGRSKEKGGKEGRKGKERKRKAEKDLENSS